MKKKYKNSLWNQQPMLISKQTTPAASSAEVAAKKKTPCVEI